MKKTEDKEKYAENDEGGSKWSRKGRISRKRRKRIS